MKTISVHVELDESMSVSTASTQNRTTLEVGDYSPPSLRICSFSPRFSMLDLCLPLDPAEALEVAEKLHGATMQLLEDTERWVSAQQEKADRS